MAARPLAFPRASGPRRGEPPYDSAGEAHMRGAADVESIAIRSGKRRATQVGGAAVIPYCGAAGSICATGRDVFWRVFAAI
jgi:hypothetical protein